MRGEWGEGLKGMTELELQKNNWTVETGLVSQ